jgi:hypothetical protein
MAASSSATHGAEPDVETPVAAGAFGAAVTFAALEPALVDAGYALFCLETAVVACAALLMGLAMMAARKYARILEHALVFVLVYFIADFYVFRHTLPAIALAMGITLLLAWPPAAPLRRTLTVAGLAFPLLVAGTAGRRLVEPALPASLAAHRADLLPVIHLVLDEHASLESLAATPQGARLAGEIERGYLQRGFRVFASSRAPSGATQKSLGRIMAYDPDGTNQEPGLARVRDFQYALVDNRYFDALRASGREVLALQNSFLRFCVPGETGCHTYSRAGHAASSIAHGLPLRERAYLLARLFHDDMMALRTVRHVALYRWAIGDRIGVRDSEHWLRPAAVLGVLDATQDLAGHADLRGRALFAHVLLPHFPYILDSQCRVVPHEQWRAPGWHEKFDRQYTRARDLAYFEQVRCLHGRVWTLIDTVDRGPGGKGAVVIIHGDHGARLREKSPNPTEAALRSASPDDSLDTFLAIRSPRHPPGVVRERAPLDVRIARETSAALAPAGTARLGASKAH